MIWDDDRWLQFNQGENDVHIGNNKTAKTLRAETFKMELSNMVSHEIKLYKETRSDFIENGKALLKMFIV